MRLGIIPAFQGSFRKAGIVSESPKPGNPWLKRGSSKISLTLSERLLHTFAYQYLLSRNNGDCACP
jgi:hypothetical protein